MKDRQMTRHAIPTREFFRSLRGALCAVPFVLAAGSIAVGQQAPTPVSVVRIAKIPVEQAPEFVARVNATDRVEVRARVKGYLEAVLFKEDDAITNGASLYRI